MVNMKKSILFLLLCPIFGLTQNSYDSLKIVSNDYSFLLPIRDGNNVVYEFIEELDSNYTEDEIYNNLKLSLSLMTKGSSVSANNSLFSVYSSDPLLYEDKNNKRIIFQINYKTIKKEGEPDFIIEDLLYFLKTDIRVKGSRVKFIIKDIDLYYQSKGMALLIGNSMSLFKVNFNGFLGSLVGVTNDGSGEVPKIENGLLKRPNYDAKRIYTIDYKIRNVIIPFLISEINKNIKDSKF
jgi:hypothetical protein